MKLCSNANIKKDHTHTYCAHTYTHTIKSPADTTQTRFSVGGGDGGEIESGQERTDRLVVSAAG